MDACARNSYEKVRISESSVHRILTENQYATDYYHRRKLRPLPEIKEQSKQLIVKGESAPKESKDRFAEKVMASEKVFWDAQGILFFVYLQKRKNINSELAGPSV